MKKIFTIMLSTLFGLLLLVGCGEIKGERDIIAGGSVGDMPDVDNKSTEIEQTQQAVSVSEDTVLLAYSAFLSGDRTLLDDKQLEMWWIPEFQDEKIEYEYTYVDLDKDGVVELLVQMVDDPCSYNAVFHYEDDKLLCWNSDATEMSCRDYPLNDDTMVRQYDYNGTRSYTIFCYQTNGEKEDISQLFAREEVLDEDNSVPCPYYEIDGQEVDKTIFEEKLAELVTDKILGRSSWTIIEQFPVYRNNKFRGGFE